MKGSKGKDQDMFLHNGPVYLVVGGGDGGDLLSSSYVLFSLEKCPETAKNGKSPRLIESLMFHSRSHYNSLALYINHTHIGILGYLSPYACWSNKGYSHISRTPNPPKRCHMKGEVPTLGVWKARSLNRVASCTQGRWYSALSTLQHEQRMYLDPGGGTPI